MGLHSPDALAVPVGWAPQADKPHAAPVSAGLVRLAAPLCQEAGISAPLCGAVSFIQRFGSSLNLNLHVHTLVPDGVFFEDEHGQVQFHPLLPPTHSDLEELIRKLVPRLLRRLGEEELPEQAE